jgi:Zn finger protein HypA/HybF involved in hydrogenase expression
MKLGTQKIFIAKDIGDFPIENIGHGARKMRVLKEQNFSCNGCGLSTWREKTITLELEHKDGNSKNNIRENLEILCPNCHSQTDTWRGRNKRVYSTDEQMIDAIKNNKSLRQALESLGMAAKGGNYKRISKLAKEISIH